ncbi:MAG: DUF1565 domain-containing protein, partial [Thermodesulfobacteriota bacterium]
MALALGLTYHVDAATGDDLRTPAEAQSAATPWKTITRAVFHAEGGDTVVVGAGTYRESVESKRDGFSTNAPIVLRSAVPGRAVVRPPAGRNGFVISHSFHTIDGFRIKRAVQGVKLGPHDGGNRAVVGLLVQNNRIQGSISSGVRVTDGVDHRVYDNTAFDNGTSDDDDVKILGSLGPTPAQTYHVDCD